LNLSTKVILVYGRKSLFLADLEKVRQKIRTRPVGRTPLGGRKNLAFPWGRVNFYAQEGKLLCPRLGLKRRSNVLFEDSSRRKETPLAGMQGAELYLLITVV